MKNKKLLRLALALGLSCNSLGLNIYAKEDRSLQSTNTVSSKDSTYTEETFFKVACRALDDVYNRMDVDKQGDELMFSYEFHFFRDKKIEKFPEGWIKYSELNEKSVREVLTCVVLSGMDHMMDGFDIILPSINQLIFMIPAAKSFIEKWKNDGTYKSKIEKIVEPYVGRLIEKFQQKLSEQKPLKDNS